MPRRLSQGRESATHKHRPCTIRAKMTAAKSLRKTTGKRGPSARGRAAGAGLPAGCAGLVLRLALLLGVETQCRVSSGDLGAGSSLVSFLPLSICVCHLPKIPGLLKRGKEVGERASRGGFLSPRAKDCTGTWRLQMEHRAFTG